MIVVKRFLFWLLITLLPLTASSEPYQFQSGKDFQTYTKPIGEAVLANGKVPIQFFFQYNCQPCLIASDNLNLYLKQNGNKVSVDRIPAAVQNEEAHAKIYYALKSVKGAGIANLLLFDSTYADKNSKYTETFAKWLMRNSINQNAVEHALNSPLVLQETARAIADTQKYGVVTVPFAVVGGRYVLTKSTLFNSDYTADVLDFLVNKIQHQAKGVETQEKQQKTN